MTFQPVLDADSLWDGEFASVDVGGRPVLLARIDGEVRAFPDACRHKGVRLSEGVLDGAVLTCRAHGWSYDLSTGAGVNPRDVALPAIAIRCVDGKICVDDSLCASATERECDL